MRGYAHSSTDSTECRFAGARRRFWTSGCGLGTKLLPNEIGEILPPSAIDATPPRGKTSDLSDRFVSKDSV
jgi:hypothetical protein